MSGAPNLGDIPLYGIRPHAGWPVHICRRQLGFCGNVPERGNFEITCVPKPSALIDLQRIKAVVANNPMSRGANTGQQGGMAWIGYSRQDAAHGLRIGALGYESFEVGDFNPTIFGLHHICGLQPVD